MIYNFIPVNKYTIKSQYLIYRIDKITDTLIESKFKAFFYIDALNGYWAVPVKEGDEYKEGKGRRKKRSLTRGRGGVSRVQTTRREEKE